MSNKTTGTDASKASKKSSAQVGDLNDLATVALKLSEEVAGLAPVEVRDGSRCVKIGLRVPTALRDGLLALVDLAAVHLDKGGKN